MLTNPDPPSTGTNCGQESSNATAENYLLAEEQPPQNLASPLFSESRARSTRRDRERYGRRGDLISSPWSYLTDMGQTGADGDLQDVLVALP